MIFHLLYVSEKSRAFADDDIDSIIGASQRNNQKLKITGILICNGNFFIQLLEGRKDQVMHAFNRISVDPRHFRVRTILTADSEKRLFPEWAMGLVREPTESTMNQILPHLHSQIREHDEVRKKIGAALKEFNRTDVIRKPA